MSFAKKNLGQNFLQSTEVRDQILVAAGDLSGKKVLEIGPGLGFLTTKLIASGADLTAIELDERAVEMLGRDFAHKKNFHLLHGSILDTDLDSLFDSKKYCTVANIPYNITSPILRKLFAETRNRPEFAILMVQKEVAEKITRTRAGQKKIIEGRSILSISVEIFAEAENLFFVSRNDFNPAPRVDSAVIRLKSRPTPLVPAEMQKDFFTVVNAGFSEKRKKIGNVIGKFFGVDSGVLLGTINPGLRAEVLEISDWIQITENFRKAFQNL